MARNKDLPSKLRRAKKLKQSKSIPSWIILRTGGKVRSSPYTRREWRNRRLKRD
ncbi:MAG: 50S ribosomal protein L39e [Promethearchaeota archaeon]|jgi:large subunit ribosomal protein L39e|nr:MAG: 50S ribosomal protein L39e [Candidatus Lokiarchaeota archaeon]